MPNCVFEGQFGLQLDCRAYKKTVKNRHIWGLAEKEFILLISSTVGSTAITFGPAFSLYKSTNCTNCTDVTNYLQRNKGIFTDTS